MKKIFAMLVVFFLSALVFSAGKTEQSKPQKEIILGAAASLTDVVNEIIPLFEAEYPHIKVTPTYGSSGSLQQQIEQGAPVDIFISASPKQMNALEEKKLILKESRKDLLLNEIVLVVPSSKKPQEAVTSFEDLAGPLAKQIALGEPKSVPAGQYAEQVLSFLTILDLVKPKTVYAKDVRQVLAYVEAGEVDAGVVYASDASIAKNIRIVAEAAQGSHSPVVYPAAIVSASSNQAETMAFLAWLSSDQAILLFKKYGFTVIK